MQFGLSELSRRVPFVVWRNLDRHDEFSFETTDQFECRTHLEVVMLQLSASTIVSGADGWRSERTIRSRMKTPTRVALLSEKQHLRQGQCVGMRDREQRRIPSHGGKSTRRTAVELQLRRTATPDHFDVAPQHAMRVARAERLQRRLPRGDTAGPMYSAHPS